MLGQRWPTQARGSGAFGGRDGERREGPPGSVDMEDLAAVEELPQAPGAAAVVPSPTVYRSSGSGRCASALALDAASLEFVENG
eukprot:5378397-Pyramimonas_sp.AAC.1